jgi:hypothetical protein
MRRPVDIATLGLSPCACGCAVMNHAKLTILAGAVLVTMFAGCATPESRIRDNPLVFAQATPEQQRLIRLGEVGLGFTPEMVRLAMGSPDHITEHEDSGGKRLIWHYEANPNYTYVGGGYGWGYGGPWYWGGGFAPVRVVEAPPSEPDKLRVMFADNRVVGIERIVNGD